MKLPKAGRAVVDVSKLRGYCLNPEHRPERHKARVFASVLGLTSDHADQLREALLAAALTREATRGEADEYGQRFGLDFEMAGPSGSATIRSSRIVIRGEDSPRLISCHVLQMGAEVGK